MDLVIVFVEISLINLQKLFRYTSSKCSCRVGVYIVDLFASPCRIWKGYSVTKGPKYAPKRKKAATDLTRENLLR